jgi:alkanesulfonate monooxygenase SsuD/methylene tetrahydromethanopterin reductase-like flavin-dependent oxidoreductase (luciferase family)
MRFGVMQIGSCRTGEEAATAYDDLLQTALTAERVGFWSMWTTEHHFGSDRTYRPYGVAEDAFPTTDYDMSPDPLMVLTHLAAKTDRIRLGTAVVVLHWDHPVRVLERAAILDVLSGGRLELGVGRGLGFRETQVYKVPVDPGENQRKFREMVEIIQQGWSGEPFEFHGEFFDLPSLILVPRPVTPTAPLWVAAGSAESAMWAAARGLPYATTPWPLTDITEHARRARLSAEAAAAAGHDATKRWNPHFIYAYCGESDAEAADVALNYMRQFRYILEGHYEWERAHSENELTGERNQVNVDIEAKARTVVDTHIVGSPETCRERIATIQREIGLNYIVCIVGFGNMPRELTIRSLERMGREVLPYFAGARVTSRNEVPAMEGKAA